MRMQRLTPAAIRRRGFRGAASVLLAFMVNQVPRKRSGWKAPFNAPRVEQPVRCGSPSTTLDRCKRLPANTESTFETTWSPRPDSNRGPFPYQGNALPPELRGRDSIRFYLLQT